MSSDPWAQAALHQQRRHWRGWPWGWIALGLSVGAWACMAVMAFLVTASIGMPGDGSHAMQTTRIPMLVTLVVAALVTLGGLIAGPMALWLRRQPAAAVVGLALLLVFVLLFGLSLLGLMA
ncbi:hypothetical protein ABQZ99_008745 [Xanthomonas hortorum pv. vitians]|uniref:Uncharacterized protein n=1 Tax=Xanthomonas hortorum pv. vitians TaxID=83224 RepID=A0A6V7EFM2_9XANT|nr:hypothetical protein [Xanthomonas hortorum]MCC4623359.1 hypothetical protein [Xanthomonas campestris pv. nigromaculans]APP85188.1 hypothetical protein BI317_14490 [Xanthomonas hortorum pv. gardneri]MCC8492622.1 hypothetical protein [Xanthomonas hortorum pv. gardneri]MCE4279822.1 hypothetical protein [Xanthomonas hortorum pv. vitians]MCE4284773.1 hypothetical protein [Xanthomonas hortorum pv. vitians]